MKDGGLFCLVDFMGWIGGGGYEGDNVGGGEDDNGEGDCDGWLDDGDEWCSEKGVEWGEVLMGSRIWFVFRWFCSRYMNNGVLCWETGNVIFWEDGSIWKEKYCLKN